MKAVWGPTGSTDSDPLPRRCEDVVIGAGITGLTTGLMLAREGREVCVLEARAPGAMASGRNTGKISLLQGTKLSEISRRQSLRVAESYLRANQDAVEWIHGFCTDHHVEIHERTALTYAAAPDELDAVRAEHETARRLGLPVTWSDEDFSPIRSWGAVLLPGQYQVDPMALIEALAIAFREAGGRLVLGARVRHVSWGQRPDVRLADGDVVRANNVVVATGSPVLDRGLQFTELSAVRSYALAFRHQNPVEQMMLSAGSDARSLRDSVDHDGQRLLLVGGSGHEVGRTERESHHLDRLRDWTAAHFPGAEEVAAWSAQDQKSMTAVPLVGALPWGQGAIRVATGFDKWGLTNGPAAAAAIAADILGTRSLHRPNAYLGTRLSPLTWLKTNTSTGLRLTRDLADVATSAVPFTRTGRRCDQITATDAATARGICPHLGGILQWNDAEESWDCPLHGSRFDADGTVLEGPATRNARVPNRSGHSQEGENPMPSTHNS